MTSTPASIGMPAEMILPMFFRMFAVNGCQVYLRR